MSIYVISGIAFECEELFSNVFDQEFKQTSIPESIATFNVCLCNETEVYDSIHIPYIKVNPYCAIFQTTNKYYLKYGEDAIIIINLENKCISIYMENKNDFFLLPYLFQADIVAVILNYYNIPILHASSVFDSSTDDVYAFLGPSKTGKSTLAAFFIRQGFSYFTDDVFPVFFKENRIFGYQSLLPLKLREQSVNFFGTSKIGKNHHNSSQCKLITKLFFLLPVTELIPIEIEEVKSKKMVYLIQNLHHHSFGLGKLAPKNISILMKCAQTIPMYTVRYTKEYNLLPDLYQAINTI